MCKRRYMQPAYQTRRLVAFPDPLEQSVEALMQKNVETMKVHSVV
jgi:hypothetical protein